MTSRFVSGGTIAGTDQTEPAPKQSSPLATTAKQEAAQWGEEKGEEKKITEWEAVQRDLEADRRRREEARRAQVEGGAGGERSLYDVLQANKAAKQAAFEEQNRIRNQFRALDDDEIEFLDDVQEKRREEEERVKRETEERLAKFREAQKKGASGPAGGEGEGEDVVDDAKNEDTAIEDPVSWSGAGKKRKRDKESKSIVKGVKRRASVHERDSKVTIAAEPEKKPYEGNTMATNTDDKSKTSATTDPTKAPAPKPTAEKAKPSLGLVDYGSDDDDD
ncbi:hypothetical protein F4806DRAFT_231469 [Annulohypoxylon nitens]|nr:hypothetical protein F4806DRAFT_231469 [Annulohypoxylon nitens]